MVRVDLSDAFLLVINRFQSRMACDMDPVVSAKTLFVYKTIVFKITSHRREQLLLQCRHSHFGAGTCNLLALIRKVLSCCLRIARRNFPRARSPTRDSEY